VTFIERKSRYWIEARAGVKTTELFAKATETAWQWAKACQYIRWFTDGERRYAQQLWQRASVYLKSTEVSREYAHRKVWRHGLEVAIKIKGSQGNRRVAWLKPEHPYTAISDKCDVHANHNEANNSALRRHCSAYRRRQNLYAKNTEGLQRAVTVQRLVHNWVRPHGGLETVLITMIKLQSIPFSAIGYLIALFLGYLVGGYLLAAYNVNPFILIGNYLITLRLAQTGSSSISLAIAWLSMWIWGAVFVWAKPLRLGEVNAQTVALLLLSCWILATGIIFLLAFAKESMYRLGLNKHKSIYGLTILTWGAMTFGWHIYQWANN
jgi:hypothetical protein